MVATPDMPLRAVIQIQKVAYGADRISPLPPPAPPSKENAFNIIVLVVAGKFAGSGEKGSQIPLIGLASVAGSPR